MKFKKKLKKLNKKEIKIGNKFQKMINNNKN